MAGKTSTNWSSDAERRLQEGHDANDAADVVPRRERSSPASPPWCRETASTSSPTSMALLVRLCKAVAHNATTVMLVYACKSRRRPHHHGATDTPVYIPNTHYSRTKLEQCQPHRRTPASAEAKEGQQRRPRCRRCRYPEAGTEPNHSNRSFRTPPACHRRRRRRRGHRRPSAEPAKNAQQRVDPANQLADPASPKWIWPALSRMRKEERGRKKGEWAGEWTGEGAG